MLPSQQDRHGPDPVASNGAAEAGIDAAAPPEAGTPHAETGPWTTLGTSGQCKVQRLVDPGPHQLFTWKPCPGIAGCEISEFGPLPPDLETDYTISHFTLVSDDGTTTRASVIVEDALGYVAFVTDAAGRVLEAFRIRDTAQYSDDCFVTAGLWKSHYGLLTSGDANGTFGLLYEQLGQGAPPVLEHPAGSWMTPMVMGELRWASGQGVVSTFSNVTGEDGYQVSYGGLADNVRAAGSSFLFEVQPDNTGPIQIEVTNGVVPAKPYLVPPAGSDYFAPAYANSCVMWLRGIDKDPSTDQYASVEIWDSPYSADPAKLAPGKLGDTALDHWTPYYAGGWGRYAFANHSGAMVAWDVTSGTRQTFALPPGLDVSEIMGLTRHHLWISADDPKNVPNEPDFLIRYALH